VANENGVADVCAERLAETVEKEMLRDSKFPLRGAQIDGGDLCSGWSRLRIAAKPCVALLNGHC